MNITTLRPKLILIFVMAASVTCCKTTAKTSGNTTPDKQAVFQSEQIGLYEALVIGQIMKENEKDYFLIDKILLRGRSLPVISEGEKILLQKTGISEQNLNTPVKGYLRCKYIQDTENCLWTFKPVEDKT